MNNELINGIPSQQFNGQAIIDGKTNFSRLTGEWITVGLEQGALGVIYRIRKCSRCGWEHSLLIPDDYCPKCGVRMKKEVKNEC